MIAFEYTDQFPMVADPVTGMHGKVIRVLKKGQKYRVKWDNDAVDTLERHEFVARYTSQSAGYEPVLDKKTRSVIG